MENRFADCIYCGGYVQERKETRELRWKGKLYIIENVPLGVCNQCGERFLKPDVAKAVDKLLEDGKPTRIASVPVLTYVTDAA